MKEWISALILVAAVVTMIAAVAALAYHFGDEQRQQVALCQRAFDYTKDQCEFIVHNHVMVSK